MKRSKTGVRLGNTDPSLILRFRDFLLELCGVKKEKIKYSLQIFGDIDKNEAMKFWSETLGVPPAAFGNPTITSLQGKGTYKRKSRYGVLQIACHNVKLKVVFDSVLELLKTRKNAVVAQLVEHIHGGAHRPPAHLTSNSKMNPE